MSEPVVALVLSPEQWVESFHRHCADHGGARVRCVVVEPEVAVEEDYQVLVVSDRWPALSRSLVGAVRATGRRVLAVSSDPSPDRVASLSAWGVDAVISVGAPGEVVGAVRALVEVAAHPCPTPPIPDPVPRPEPLLAGVVAVAGRSGSGVTEIALAIAARRADRGDPIVLVDAAAGPVGLKLRLGLTPGPTLREAVGAVEYGLGRLDAALVPTGRRRLRVVRGLPDRGPSPSAAEVVAVARHLVSRGARVVVDLGEGPFLAEADARDAGPGVFAVAGMAVLVADGSPSGVLRLFDTIGGLAAPVVSRLEVVVNRVPRRKADRVELADEIVRAFPVSVHLVPDDARVRDAAWAGTLVGRGPFGTALQPLAARVAGDTDGPVAPPDAASGRRRRSPAVADRLVVP